LVINDGGANYDFRVEGDTDANLLVADASADAVGVGTASPAGKLNSVSTAASLTYPLTLSNLTDATTDVGAGIDFRLTTGNNSRGYIACRWTSGSGSNGTYLSFAPNDGSTGNVERMRILSGGSVCVNTTAAVVDSTSRLVVSNTTASGVAAEFSNNTNTTATVVISNSGAATASLLNWIASGSFRAGVTWNGTNIIYGTPSDQRLKENIVDASSALPLIDSIRIRSFDFKENGKHIDFGVIAQELVSVVPEAVLTGKDNEDGSIKESWSVDTSILVPALVKAIQELSAKNDALEARIAALEQA
jgi:hypothetical protein